jgi:hypothetical protein
MSTATIPIKPVAFVERGSDWLNPILVKETRQALKSRQFVATFLLMLVASWLISVFGIVLAGAGAEYGNFGGGFFFAYYLVLAVAVFLIVPFGAFRSLLAERDQHTWEVLSITTLKPRQIVWGKLLSAMVQIFIYYSAITPFMAFAKLLKGIDVPTIATVLVASLLWSLALSMIGLTASTFGSERTWQVFLTLAMLAGLLGAFIFSLMIVGSWAQVIEFDSLEFWWMIAFAVTMIGAYCVLFLQVAIGQLTFDADNRTTNVRLAASGVFFVSLAWAYAWTTLSGVWGIPAIPATEIAGVVQVLAVLWSLHWLFVGLFAVTEADVLSRRVRRNLAWFGPFRVLLAPLVPGGARGLMYVAMHLAVILGFAYFELYVHSAFNQEAIYFVSALCAYLFIYLGLGSLLGRLARRLSGDFRPAHARVTTVLLIAFGSLLPQPLRLLEEFNLTQMPYLGITDPFSTLTNLASINEFSAVLMLLLAFGVFAVLLLNLPALLSGIVDLARAPILVPPSRQRAAPEVAGPVPVAPEIA